MAAAARTSATPPVSPSAARAPAARAPPTLKWITAADPTNDTTSRGTTTGDRRISNADPRQDPAPRRHAFARAIRDGAGSSVGQTAFLGRPRGLGAVFGTDLAVFFFAAGAGVLAERPPCPRPIDLAKAERAAA